MDNATDTSSWTSEPLAQVWREDDGKRYLIMAVFSDHIDQHANPLPPRSKWFWIPYAVAVVLVAQSFFTRFYEGIFLAVGTLISQLVSEQKRRSFRSGLFSLKKAAVRAVEIEEVDFGGTISKLVTFQTKSLFGTSEPHKIAWLSTEEQGDASAALKTHWVSVLPKRGKAHDIHRAILWAIVLGGLVAGISAIGIWIADR